MGGHSETDDVDAAHWTREHAADSIVATADIRKNFVEENRLVFAVISGRVSVGSERDSTHSAVF